MLMSLESYRYLHAVQNQYLQLISFYLICCLDENQDLEMCRWSIERSCCHQEDGDCQPSTARSSDQDVDQGVEIATESPSPSNQ